MTGDRAVPLNQKNMSVHKSNKTTDAAKDVIIKKTRTKTKEMRLVELRRGKEIYKHDFGETETTEQDNESDTKDEATDV